MTTIAGISGGMCAAVAALLSLATGCGTSSDGSNAGSGGSGSSSGGAGSGTVPAGFTLAAGVVLGGDASGCNDFSTVSCSGHCVTTSEATNGCRAVTTARIFSEFARDAQGLFLSEQRSSSSGLWSVDATSGTLVQLAQPAGDNEHLKLALSDDLLYFISNKTLSSVPRAGGQPTQLLADVGYNDRFVVAGTRVFAKVSLDPEVDEISLSGGATTKHTLDAGSLARDGNDLYYTVGQALFRASNADLSAPTQLGPASDTILGFAGDSIYTAGGVGAERTIQRIAKAGGSVANVFKTGPGLAALANDALAFTLKDGGRYYVCTVDLQGHSPTVVGYLGSSPSLLAADEHFVYATVGFNLLRMKR